MCHQVHIHVVVNSPRTCTLHTILAMELHKYIAYNLCTVSGEILNPE